MSEDVFTYKEFIDGLKKREFPLYSDLVKKLPNLLMEYVNEEEVKYFYPKNLFEEEKKELYIFLSEKIIHVNIDKREVIFKTIKSGIVEATYKPGVSDINTVSLTLRFENGNELFFDNKNDNSKEKHWREVFSQNIKEIYKSL